MPSALQEKVTGSRPTSFWAEPLRVVCREPVATLTAGLTETDWDEKHPFVEAKVTDFKGNRRTLKVYFSVGPDMTRIRVLERKHLKN